MYFKQTKEKCCIFAKFFLNFSGYDCHLIFENLINLVFEKRIEMRRDVFVAKSSQKCKSVK